ncbi:MAG TPA: hypothetical protein VKU02_02100, partial [Gemmataceae bacterium]|nr:hypothetical protein [Gemmataceae bacterium]
MSDCHSTPFDVPCKSAKPSKPDPTYPDFPLYAHTACVWAKKIGGRGHYFGKWDDPHAALKKYLEHKDDLHAGRTPRPDPQALKVKDIANAFLNAKREAQEAGELSSRTWLDCRFIMDMLVEGLGKHRSVTDLAP